MTMGPPQHHAPLLTLAKTALLRVGLPVGVVAAVLYGMTVYKSPSERYTDQFMANTKAQLSVGLRKDREATEKQYQQAVNHPDAKRIAEELSKLPPEQRAKRSMEIMEEYAKKLRAEQP
jgi:hypothetical protein